MVHLITVGVKDGGRSRDLYVSFDRNFEMLLCKCHQNYLATEVVKNCAALRNFDSNGVVVDAWLVRLHRVRC